MIKAKTVIARNRPESSSALWDSFFPNVPRQDRRTLFVHMVEGGYEITFEWEDNNGHDATLRI